MFSGLLSSRLIQAVLALFVLVVGGSLLYSWHVQRNTEDDMAQHDRFLEGIRETQNERHSIESVNVENTTNTAESVETPTERDTNIARDTETPEATTTIPSASESVDAMDAFLPDDIATEEARAEEVAVSPFGFGPYPEVPAGYTARHKQTVWQYPGSLPLSAQRNIELLHRVMVSSWNKGDTQFISATFKNGKVYLNYPNTMYVSYVEHERSDGTVQRFIKSWSSGERNQSAIDEIEAGKIPKGVTLIDIDSEDVGIDAYAFLERK